MRRRSRNTNLVCRILCCCLPSKLKLSAHHLALPPPFSAKFCIL
jgi:hypothetical protein